MTIKSTFNLINRELFLQILDHLPEREMTVIVGPRQSGKTTLLEQLQDYLINERKISPEQIFYFNLDLARHFSLFSSQENIINFIKDRQKENQTIYLLIDEVQRIANIGIFLKGIYDLKLNIKFILTGSSSLEIKSKIQEALTGRKKIFKLLPLKLSEAAIYFNPAVFQIILKSKAISEYDFTEWEKIISDLAVFGGYPRIITEQNINKKIELIEELYNSYLEKDVVNLLRVKNTVSFNQLVSLLSAQTCGMLNVNELAKNTAAEVKTINHYIDILENTFIIKLIKPFFTNAKKELIKMPKIYFFDNGIRNFALSRFDPLSQRVDKGEVFENLVASELLKIIKPPHSLHYWRSLQKAEVDFVIRKGDGELIPLEVKAEKMSKPSVGRSYHSFLADYKPKTGLIVNYSLREELKIGETNLLISTIADLEKIVELG